MYASETRYRDIVESQIDLICRYTPDGIFTFVNQAFCQYMQKPQHELLGRNCLDLFSEERRSLMKQNAAALSSDKASFSSEIALRSPNGRVVWEHWTDQGIFDAQGRLLEIQSVGHNITDQKLAEITATRYARELSALHTATVALLTTLDLETLLGHILDAAIGAIPRAEKGILYLIARDTGKLEMRAVLGFAETDPRIQRLASPKHVNYVAKVVNEREPLLLNRALVTGETYPQNGTFRETGVQSAIAAPLIMQGHVLGALALETSYEAAFTETDLRLLTSFAATATAAIHNAQLHAKVQQLAITDGLTGLYNRRGFYEVGRREIERALRYKRPLAAIMLDIDSLKSINDIHGHDAGDTVLCFVANTCHYDTRKVDIAGRYGGDEFVLLLPENGLFTAAGVAERLRSRISETSIQYQNTTIDATISLGVVKLMPGIKDVEAMIKRADEALHAAKQAGRNRVEIR